MMDEVHDASLHVQPDVADEASRLEAPCLEFEVVSEIHAREAVEYGLMEAGATGTWLVSESAERVCLRGFFDHQPPVQHAETQLAEALRIYNLETSLIEIIGWRKVQQRDWLAEWKRNWQPTFVDPFIIAAPWSDVRSAPDAHVIRIEPGMAFGTGTHETTRLCLRLIADYGADAASVLDVGTGTGILAIAAAKLLPQAKISACDTDADAVRIAIENAGLNGVGDRIDFRIGGVDDAILSADLVVANLTADVILPLLPALLRLTCVRLVLSGILDTQADAVRGRLAQLGVNASKTLEDGEWVAIVA